MNAVTLVLLVQFHYQSKPHIWNERGEPSQALVTGLGYLIQEGLVSPRENRSGLISPGYPDISEFEITQKGRVHVTALLRAPLPTNNWVSSIPEVTL